MNTGDFTFSQYRRLVHSFLDKEYKIISYYDFLSGFYKGRLLILRHDIDRVTPATCLMAEFEKSLGIKSTYYFKENDGVFPQSTINKVTSAGHEAGYHYQDLYIKKGDPDKAIRAFEKNLNTLRNICKVDTICMDGYVLSKWDNRELWKKYNYRDYGILGETYLDTDFSKVLYLTETGRKWNAENKSRYDKTIDKTLYSKFKYKNTNQLIESIHSDELPDVIMMTIHPQRWHDHFGPWFFDQNDLLS